MERDLCLWSDCESLLYFALMTRLPCQKRNFNCGNKWSGLAVLKAPRVRRAELQSFQQGSLHLGGLPLAPHVSNGISGHLGSSGPTPTLGKLLLPPREAAYVSSCVEALVHVPRFMNSVLPTMQVTNQMK